MSVVAKVLQLFERLTKEYAANEIITLCITTDDYALVLLDVSLTGTDSDQPQWHILIGCDMRTNQTLAEMKLPLDADWITATCNLFNSVSAHHHNLVAVDALIDVALLTRHAIQGGLQLGGRWFEQQDSGHGNAGARGYLYRVDVRQRSLDELTRIYDESRIIAMCMARNDIPSDLISDVLHLKLDALSQSVVS